MNLAYPLDDTVVIDEKTYELDMSFNNILILFDLLQDKTIDDVTKVKKGLFLLIDDELEENDIEERAKIFVEIFKNAVGETKKKQLVDLDGNQKTDKNEDEEK